MSCTLCLMTISSAPLEPHDGHADITAGDGVDHDILDCLHRTAPAGPAACARSSSNKIQRLSSASLSVAQRDDIKEMTCR